MQNQLILKNNFLINRAETKLCTNWNV